MMKQAPSNTPDPVGEARAAGCFGGACALPAESGSTAMDMDRFVSLYTHNCVCRKPKGWACTLADAQA
ncbi:MAG: hypothetical protein IPN84_01380 [Sphingomonadales bacterium]|nr:hypothetical protein [Sphingomonadales bacterium]